MKKKTTLSLLSAFAGFVVFNLIIMAVDNRHFKVREYTIHSDKVRKPLTFVFVSDLHAKVYPPDNRKVLQTIDRLHPDAVLIGGDLIVSRKATSRSDDWLTAADRFTQRLGKRYPVFYVNGNHEQRLEESFPQIYEKIQDMLARNHIMHLQNTCTDFKGIRIWGYDPQEATYSKIFSYHLSEQEVQNALGKSSPLQFNLLLTHNPKYFDAYAQWGADLAVCGHVHGGLLRLFGRGFIGPDLHLFPRYSGGLYRLKKAHMVVSCGLGAHTLPIRIFNPGEISMIRLLPEGTEHGNFGKA